MNLTAGVNNYLDCSTKHITEKDDTFLQTVADGNVFDSPLIVINKKYGYWVNVPSDKDAYSRTINSYISGSLKDIIRKAKIGKCNWILLDNAGFEHDDLQSYDW